jgi:hypothetical protein
MSLAYQVVDVVIAALLAGLSSFLVSVVLPEFAVTTGIVLACMYYFWRNPWGAVDGAAYNERIDEVYDRVLPV